MVHKASAPGQPAAPAFAPAPTFCVGDTRIRRAHETKGPTLLPVFLSVGVDTLCTFFTWLLSGRIAGILIPSLGEYVHDYIVFHCFSEL